MTKLFQVKAQRSGDWWALSVDGMPGVHSQARVLAKAESAVKEAIALVHDWDPDEFAVVVNPELPAGVLSRVIESRRMVADAERQQHEAAIASREVAKALLASGLSQRDAAYVMGVSFQRVNQLVA